MSKKYMDRGHLLNILIALVSRECDGVKTAGFIHNQQTAIIDYKNTAYYIWDNGGEIGVEKINSGMSEFVPLSVFGNPLNALTVAYRIGQVLNEKSVNYDFLYNNEESSDFFKVFGRKEEMYKHMYGEENENDDEAEM